MTMITSGILMLRNGKSADWTTELDTQMNNWTSTYITWLKTNTLAIQEEIAVKLVQFIVDSYSTMLKCCT